MLSRKPDSGLLSGLPYIFILITLLIATTSCENSEGYGGTGSISGSITEHFFNDDYSKLIYSQAAVDEEVYILFGSDEALGDGVHTGVSGSFRFDYLYPGTYYVYFKSDDSTAIPDDGWSEPLEVLLEDGEGRDLEELAKINSLDYDEGSSSISGVVKKIKYANGSNWPNLVIDYVDFAHEQEIYLTYGNHEFYDERVRTQDNGVFKFTKLIPGDYRIFLYSEDVTRVTEHIVLEYEVSITEFGQHIDLGEITIEDL